jgi:endonuclease/exonuclease/phosphatase family metal-dependent hydrolase
MKRFCLGGCALFWGVMSLSAEPLALNVVSFNLRYANSKDGPNAWEHRKDMAATVFTAHQVDFAGVQEALAVQLADLKKSLPDYDCTGVGRDDGKSAGEHAAIFYHRKKFDLVRSGTFWLSQHPEVTASKGWDAALPRIATWGIFRSKASGREVFVANTHWDHKGIQAREEGAKVLMNQLSGLCGKRPVILTGDFNDVEDSPGLRQVTACLALPLVYAQKLAKDPKRGATSTFNGFQEGSPDKIIDFIFVSPGIRVEHYRYLPIRKQGVFVSDHWPVVARLVLPEEKS